MSNPGQASLRIEWAPDNIESVDLQHNPTEISLEKGVTLAEIAIPGLTAPLQQFVRGQAEMLHLELFFDTSDQGMGLEAVSVATLTDKIYALTRIVPDQHAPPIVTFIWGEGFPGHQLPWQLGNQGRVHLLMSAHAMGRIETLYGTVFQDILGEKISTKPVEVATPFPWRPERGNPNANLKKGG